MKELAGRAREGKLMPEEFQGGGFSCLQPRHVRHLELHLDRQSAPGLHPFSGRGRTAAHWWHVMAMYVVADGDVRDARPAIIASSTVPWAPSGCKPSRAMIEDACYDVGVSPRMSKVNFAEKFALFSEHWSPKIVGEIERPLRNQTRYAIQGDFVWHAKQR